MALTPGRLRLPFAGSATAFLLLAPLVRLGNLDADHSHRPASRPALPDRDRLSVHHPGRHARRGGVVTALPITRGGAAGVRVRFQIPFQSQALRALFSRRRRGCVLGAGHRSLVCCGGPFQPPGTGGPTAGPEWWQLAILIPALILGVTGPFVTTILGWVAVSQIRRSAGRIHGLQLALFDGLVFPLMALGAVIALAGVALAKMFVDFYANPSVVGHSGAPLVTRMANWLSLNNEVGVFVGVVAAIVVNVLIVRAVMRTVRKGIASAPPESSATGNEIKVASIAIIFALIGTALGALAALRNAGAWPAMALSLVVCGPGDSHVAAGAPIECGEMRAHHRSSRHGHLAAGSRSWFGRGALRETRMLPASKASRSPRIERSSTSGV